MPKFAALLRKDSQPVRYLVVDDSVFARKNIIKMVQLFGGEIAGEAGDDIRFKFSGYADGGARTVADRSLRVDVAERSGARAS